MKAQTNRRLRQFHHYLGVLFAPAIIFFAVSGAFQTFRWQEEKGYGGTPPQWIVWIASVHKDQAEPRVRPPEAARAAERPKAAANKPARKSALPLKIFVTAMSAGLALSALLGIVVALNIRSMRRVSLVMLVLGTLLPLVLLKL